MKPPRDRSDGLGGERVLRQRVAARLLLASCTLALGLGLGTAVGVVAVLALQHPQVSLRAPGERETTLDGGVHQLVLPLGDPAEPDAAQARPSCTVADSGTGRAAPAIASTAGFAAVRVPRAGRYRLACTAAQPVNIVLRHQTEGVGAYLTAVGRGLVPAVILTVLAAVLAAKALVAARRLQAPGR